MSTYGDLLPQITRNLGNKDDVDFLDTVLSSFNAAQRLLAWVHDWPELQVILNGSSVKFTSTKYQYTTSELGLIRYRKPKDFILLPTGERGRELQYLSPSKWRREVAPRIPTAINSKPSVYTIWGRNFLFHPTPDSAYLFDCWYYQYPSTIINSGSTIQYEDADAVLIYLTTAFVFLSYEEVEMSTQWVQKATEWMRSYGVAHTNVAELEAAFTSTRSSILQSDYWTDPFQKSMP